MKLSTVASLAANRAALVATVAHAIADRNLATGVIALPLIVAAGVVIRRSPSGGLRLPRRLTNLLLLGVLALAVVRVPGASAADGLGVVSDAVALVIAVMVVKLFERKAARDLALVLMLSVFVVIGAILTDNRLASSLFVLIAVPLIVRAAALQQLLAAQERAHARAAPELALAGVEFAEWSPDTGSGGRARRDLRRLVGAMLASSALVAVVVFVVVPRGIGMNRLSEWTGAGVGRKIGFNDEIHLGTGGFLQDSSAPVMDVTIREATGERLGSPGTIYYLRGAVLDSYARGSWTASQTPQRRSSAGVRPGVPIFLDTGAGARLAVEITLRNAPSERTHLFTMWRPASVELDQQGVLESGPGATLTFKGPGGRLDYRVEAIPAETFRSPPAERSPGARFDSEVVRARASAILEGVGISPDPALRPIADDGRAARALEQHFFSGHAYSLEAVATPAGRDPIEHFLETSRLGHCEDFASAMAAMCRSVGIPARIVTGFVAAEFNEASGHYVVRESNAHAWVEVETGAGRWRVFDPTPPDSLDAIHTPRATLATRARQLLDALEYAWINSIVSFDQSRQERLFLTDEAGAPGLLSFLDRLRQGAVGTRDVLRALARGLVVFAGVAVMGFSLRQILSIIPTTRRWVVRPGPFPAFADELDRRLARAGHPRPPWCPRLEFVRALALRRPDLAAPAEVVVEAAYRARFAGRTVSGEDLARVRGALASLARAGPTRVLSD